MILNNKCCRIVLKTENGYLTEHGSTNDIYSKHLLILNISFSGKFTKIENIIKEFKRRTIAPRYVFEDLSKLKLYVYAKSPNGQVDLYELKN